MKNIIKVIASTALMAVLLSACTPGDSKEQKTGIADGPNVLRVLAGSEIKDMGPVLADLERETGVKMVFEYAGTLEGTQEVAQGSTKGIYDATWFPSNRYLSLLDGGPEAVKSEEKIMKSAVILGVKPDKAAQLGWDKKNPTWNEILEAVKAGKLKYGMTSPVSSNSGFATLIGAATALSGTGDALTVDNVTHVSPSLQELFKGQTLTSGSSGWLAEKFAATPEQDAIFNYESVLAGMAVEGKPLTLITPSDGTVTADYPFSLLSSTTDEKKALYAKARDYLVSDAVQTKIHETTRRVTKTTSSAQAITTFELPFPDRLDVVQSLLTAYLENIKKPSHMVFDIDTSGSMGGARIAELKKALSTMTQTTGGYNSFIAFQSRETINYIEFSDRIKSDRTFQITEATKEKNLSDIQGYINGLNPDGGTAIYDSLEQSYRNALLEKQKDPESFTSIVLFSDGESNRGKDYQQFVSFYNDLIRTSPEAKTIPVYAVLFGEVNSKEMKDLSALTNGKLFDATSSSLPSIFKEIRGYQ
jgi:Ca-activated chloride channel family protein